MVQYPDFTFQPITPFKLIVPGVQLGHVPDPLHHQAPLKKNQDTPSRQQRRDRRAPARNATAEEAEQTDTEKVSSLEEAVDEQSSDTAEKVEESVNHLEEAIVEIVANEHAAAAEADHEVSDFVCDVCDNKFKNLRGLRAHKGRIHKAANIIQLDGAVDTDCDMSEECLTFTFVSDFHQEEQQFFPM